MVFHDIDFLFRQTLLLGKEDAGLGGVGENQVPFRVFIEKP